MSKILSLDSNGKKIFDYIFTKIMNTLIIKLKLALIQNAVKTSTGLISYLIWINLSKLFV